MPSGDLLPLKIGFVTDIHESIEALQRALDRLNSLSCEKVYCLGDILMANRPDSPCHRGSARDAHECIRLLREGDVVTVAGNHDLEGIRKLPRILPAGWEMPDNFFNLPLGEQEKLSHPGRGEHPKGLWWVNRHAPQPNITTDDMNWLHQLPEQTTVRLQGWKLGMMHWMFPNPTGYAVNYPSPESIRDHFKWQKENSIPLVFCGHQDGPGIKWISSRSNKIKEHPFNEPLFIDREDLTLLVLPGVRYSRIPNGVSLFDTEQSCIVSFPLGDGNGTLFYGWTAKKKKSQEKIVINTDTTTAKGTKVHLNLSLRNQFALKGRWLRGSLHCHISGTRKDSPRDRYKEWIEFYRKEGFDFLAATDHDKLWRTPPEEKGLILIPGIEQNHPHVIILNIRNEIPDKEDTGKGIAEVIDEAEKEGGLVILPHPSSTPWDWDDIEKAAEAGLTGIEVAHSKGFYMNGRHRADQLWYLLLEAGYFPAAIGSDDSHFVDEDAFGKVAAGKAWTGVLASEYSLTGILNAIRQKRTYASEGPQFTDIRIDGNTLIVECTPCLSCHFNSYGAGAYYSDFMVRDQPQRTTFSLDLLRYGTRLKKFLVIVLEDNEGRRAWTSAMKLSVDWRRI